MGLSILLIEDDTEFARRLSSFLVKEGHHVQHADSGEEGVEVFERGGTDCVILDLFLPGMDGIQTLEKLKQIDATTIVMVMTAHGSIDTAVNAMRLGALDYLTKPVDLEALCLKLNQAREVLGLRSDLGYMLERDRRGRDFESFIGSAPVMRAVYDKIREVAKTDNTTVLVTGPSGTGKELVARAIHTLSARSKKPLMQVDCTSIPLTLMESELFGHTRGAFSGADRTKRGLLELADGGSLLLDEIGDMAVDLQAKLLRVLQERQFRRVGGTRDHRFDVRVIAATNQDLDALAETGQFRRDLLYRLKVFEIALPPLCERGDDILGLADAFVREFSSSFRKTTRSLDSNARSALTSYGFPGNVRELRNIIEQAVILAKGEVITRDLLSMPEKTATAPASGSVSLEALGEKPLQAAERMLIEQALEKSGDNKKRAAELLGISRFALQRKLEKIESDD